MMNTLDCCMENNGTYYHENNNRVLRTMETVISSVTKLLKNIPSIDGNNKPLNDIEHSIDYSFKIHNTNVNHSFKFHVDSNTYNVDNLLKMHDIISRHYNFLLKDTDPTYIKGLERLIRDKMFDLTEVVSKYGSLMPGFQFTMDRSLILAFGTKNTDSLLVEYYYDDDIQDFEEEVSLFYRSGKKTLYELIRNADINKRIKELLK